MALKQCRDEKVIEEVISIQLEVAIRQKLVSTESFLIASHFLIASRDYMYLRTQNWSAQKKVCYSEFLYYCGVSYCGVSYCEVSYCELRLYVLPMGKFNTNVGQKPTFHLSSLLPFLVLKNLASLLLNFIYVWFRVSRMLTF